MGGFFIWLYLKNKEAETARRWKLECEDEEMRRKYR